jgi:hypothetical protein
MYDDVHVVHKTEHHRLSTCPCDSCKAERQRRQISFASFEARQDRHLVKIPIQTARLLGFLKHN